ncbi:helix-turn-helix transcriptional regulator [Caldimonas brevitalea]|uniref:HTH luxR-type domain-containing protein n=1 Tax=Caldimonas brevitalea TaxID=413882 RepID=A0A0G3BGM0_9BURK|nr:LuxR C-terminal-related transcriptional regulator [Caldimonas brevitalea]AKJ28589.1 hypothetical protein AAW51_1898 [Caldimonas brevitalea]
MRPDPGEVLAEQRRLRAALLDRRAAVDWPQARELACHLLLRLDDADACWRFATEWLCEHLDVDRVDGGYAHPGAATYRLAHAQARREDPGIPSLEGITVDNRGAAMLYLWASQRAVVFDDIAQTASFTPTLRADLLRAGTRSKIAIALWADGRPLGLLCIDHVLRQREWRQALFERFGGAATQVLAPVLWAAARLGEPRRSVAYESPAATPSGDPVGWSMLTPAERRVAALVAEGRSYKEIARQLNRSFSTVDHQLRSIREKLGASSTARVAALLAGRR